ncbi:unnamed protein product [Parnassius apollo]|uniref:(apollo) hypothetical protein n=1 Tax=Parnassius apollo TaxID=110799 RepID=A0A8S3WVD2_PARAO|nr:unnamed protein product [Parnassius apollo]
MSRLINEENRNVSADAVREESANANTEMEDAVVFEGQSSDSMMISTVDIENHSAYSDSDTDYYDGDTGFDTEREEQFTETITSALSMHCHENTTQQRSIAVV